MKTRIFNIDRLVRENVKNLKPYSSARDEYVSDGSEKIFLDANENPFDSGVNRYPDPQQRSVKSVLAGLRGLPEESILLGNGSDEVLDLIYRAFCEPGIDNIITLPPTYGMYKVLAGINGVMNTEVPLKESFELDVEAILNAVNNRTKIIFICSPNNPTGNRFRQGDILHLLKSFEGLLVLDEAYIDFCKEGSFLELLGEYPNLIISQTLSKAYGMAGIRLGIAYASAEIIEVLNRIKPPYNVNELTQKAALERLADQNSLREQVAQILSQRDLLITQLEQIPFVEKVFPSEANFLLARVDNAQKRYDQILEKGIVVRNRSNLPLCENTLRFTVGTETENKELINVLKTI